jgi:flagellar biosynthesis protein FlhF
VRFLSLDDTRIGASEQLRSCATILGAEFLQASPDRQILAPLAAASPREVVLIDTPGFGGSEDRARLALAEALAPVPHLETHLVLMASAGSADLRSAMQRWRSTNPTHLLLTHLDDAAGMGPAVDLVIHSGLPLSFVSSGRRIPEDLDAANPDHLINLLLDKEKHSCVAAA